MFLAGVDAELSDLGTENVEQANCGSLAIPLHSEGMHENAKFINTLSCAKDVVVPLLKGSWYLQLVSETSSESLSFSL